MSARPSRKRPAGGEAPAAKRQRQLSRLSQMIAPSSVSRIPVRYPRMSQSELKFFDTATSFTLDATGEVLATGQLNLIPQGVTESTRVGRKCVLKSIQGRWDILYVPSSGATATTSYAIYLVLDKQANGAAAAMTDVFTGTSATQALHNLSNSQRFVVLKKWVQTMTSPAGVSTAYNNVLQHIDWYTKCNIPLEFSGTTGAITELRSNNVFLLAGANNTDDAITVSGNVRVRFSDGS